MRLDKITRDLDAFFRIKEFSPDSPFSFLVPEAYEKTGIQLENYLSSAFLDSFHGLMTHNSQNISMVYCTVFLSEEILDKVFARGVREVLLISHHPLVMETSDRGFLPLSENYFREMRKNAISVYVIHTPLDVNDRVSTSRALARELRLEDTKGFYQYSSIGYSGIYGHLPTPIKFENLLGKISNVTNVCDLHFIKNREVMNTLGIIPGGTDANGIMEAADLGCDALLTGTYYNQVKNEIGKQYREAFNKIKDNLEISLIECSHYAGEAVVMQTDMVDICVSRFGIGCEFIPQDNPWY